MEFAAWIFVEFKLYLIKELIRTRTKKFVYLIYINEGLSQKDRLIKLNEGWIIRRKSKIRDEKDGINGIIVI